MTHIIPFDFQSNTVRVTIVSGEYWFVAKDICEVLEIQKPENAYARLDDDEKGTHSIGTLGGNQEMTVVSESGLYSLVLTSRKPQAKEFKRWLTHEVIPSIRKTGQYSINQQPVLPSRVVARETAEEISKIQDLLSHDNPRLAQFLIDHAISDIMPAQKVLTGDRLRGVVEIAEELKLPVTIHNRSTLGKFVKANLPDLCQIEQRLVNGTTRKVNCYPDNDKVRAVIQQFFS